MKIFFLILRIIISTPKTIIFNLITFKLSTAVLLPVYIDYSVKIKGTYKGAIQINTKVKPFMIKIGLLGSEAVPDGKGVFYMNKKQKGKLIFYGEAKFGTGCVLFNNSGITIFGNNFSSNKNCFIASDSSIKFGDDVLLGWNINIRNSDGHTITYENKKEKKSDVEIGNHVWISSYVDILKGSSIGNDCVIGYRSLVSGLKCGDNNLIAGSPAKVIRNNIEWKK